MLSIKGKGIGITASRLTTYSSPEPIGSKLSSRAPRMETASGGASTSLSAAGGSNTANQDGFLTGLMSDNMAQLNKMHRDMYSNDAICGSAVDLQSALPFSDFDIFGVSEDRIEAFQSAIAQLNLRSSAEHMTRHYMVDGAYASTLVFDKATTTFRDQIPYEFQNLKFDWSPLLSQDPVITAKVGTETKKFLSADGQHHRSLLKSVPAPLLRALKEGEFELDPLSTIFLARRPFMHGGCVSYLRRCLPAYLIEKTLYRGTLFEVGRRQRANVHVQAGDDLWEPTPEELSALANVFQQTDLDPMGAIVVTRNAITVGEFRQAGDFLKWTDVFDILTTIKLKALGISDSFLSSDSTYSNADNALVIFMENQNAYRDFWTHTVLTNKIFPLIATVKGYYKGGQQGKREQANDSGTGLAIKTVNDTSKLDIPQVRWRKRLTAGNDQNLFDSLEKMAEKGIPVPYRLWIAASGLDASTLLNELSDNDNLEKQFDQYRKPGDIPGAVGDDSSMMTEMSSLRKPPRLVADWGNLSDAHYEDSQGRRHYSMNQTQANRRINETIAKAAARLAVEDTYLRVHKDLVAAGLLRGKSKEVRQA